MTEKRPSIAHLFIAAAALFTVGCASARSRNGFDSVQQTLLKRSSEEVHWNSGTQDDQMAAGKIRSLLSQPLSVDSAVQVALLNNPSLQANFEEIGIAQADLVQAGLLQNPVFSGAIGFPKDGGSTATQFSVSQNFLDLIALPLRRRAAKAQFKQAQLEIADEVLMLEAEVRAAFYTVQGAQQMLDLRKKVLEATQISNDLAKRQHKAGNLSALDIATQQAVYNQAELDFSRNEAELSADQERLSLLLGVSAGTDSWKISGSLAELPSTDPGLQEVEERAVSQRLDLTAAKEESLALGRFVTAARFGSGTTGISLGVEKDKDAEGNRTTGPTFSLPLPVFDRNQAASAKARAQYRQSQKRLQALEARIRSEVRMAFNQLALSRHIVEFSRTNVLPLQEQVVTLSQRYYNYMLLGVYQLILARQNEIISQRDYINALRDYWIARATLERVTGGALELSKMSSSQPAYSEAHQREIQ